MPKRGNGEGSIYRRKSDGKWVGSITLQSRQRKVFYGRTRAEVAEKVNNALHDQQKGIAPSVTSKATVEQYLKSWLEVEENTIKPRTYERYEEIVRLHIVPVLGRYQLQKLTRQQVQELYKIKQKEGLSPTTVNTIHNVFHKALESAVQWEIVPRNVCDLTSPPARGNYEFVSLQPQEIHHLLTVARGRVIEPLLTLALVTGMRRGELLGLKWQDIDFKAETLQVRRTMSRIPRKFRKPEQKAYSEAPPKTKKSKRSIVLIPLALEALKQHQERQLEARKKAGEMWVNSNLVFCTSIGTPMNPTRDVIEPFKVLLQEAKLPNIRFHDLRHSASTLLLSLGIHPKIVQEILGHSNIVITLTVYSHVLPTMQEDAMNKMHNKLKELEQEQQPDEDEQEGGESPQE